MFLEYFRNTFQQCLLRPNNQEEFDYLINNDECILRPNNQEEFDYLINNDVHDVLLFQDYIGTHAYFMLRDNMENDGNGLHDYF